MYHRCRANTCLGIIQHHGKYEFEGLTLNGMCHPFLGIKSKGLSHTSQCNVQSTTVQEKTHTSYSLRIIQYQEICNVPNVKVRYIPGFAQCNIRTNIQHKTPKNFLLLKVYVV